MQLIVPVTSGSKGMHLYVPLPDPISSEAASGWARQVAQEMQKALPRLVVWKMSKALRDGKVFFDWSQNAAAKTTIAPYSMRGREHPMVAAPRTWDELSANDFQHLDYRQVMARVAAGIDPLGELHGPRRAGRPVPGHDTGRHHRPAAGPATKAVAAHSRTSRGRSDATARAGECPRRSRSSSALPMELSPMLASPGRAEMVTDPALWRWEGKWDGMRALAFVVGSRPGPPGDPGALSVRSRIGRDNTAAFPELWELPELLAGHSAVLDGEIVCFDQDGRTDFGMMQQRMGQTRASVIAANSKRFPASFLVFDVLHLDGISLLGKRYDDRRRILAALPLNGEHCTVPEQMTGTLADVMARTEAARWEGIVGKRVDSTYTPGARTRSWVKVKHLLSMEAVIVGWQPGQGGRSDRIGSLVMAVPGTDEHRKPHRRLAVRRQGRHRFHRPSAAEPRRRTRTAASGHPTSGHQTLRRRSPRCPLGATRTRRRGRLHRTDRSGGTFRHPRWRGRRYHTRSGMVCFA